MKIAIMQPYLFPYIGYWQLINAVDKFIILDDVNYINKGWINRNRLQVNGKEFLFTLPLRTASQNKMINEIFLHDFARWKSKFLRTLETAYKKAPNYDLSIQLIYDCLNHSTSNLSAFLVHTINCICSFLDIKTKIVETSASYNTGSLNKAVKIISICQQEKAKEYINAIGGSNLYEKEEFKKNGIILKFMESSQISYCQPTDKFVPNLSIIDILFQCEKDKIRQFLQYYSLV